jgi:peroxiredoxin Q/BCP
MRFDRDDLTSTAQFRYPSEMLRMTFVVTLLLAATVAGAEELVVGSKAPPFSLMGSDGRIHTLAEHAGKRDVVLAWFPKAFTPG